MSHQNPPSVTELQATLQPPSRVEEEVLPEMGPVELALAAVHGGICTLMGA
jgi:hypothetical protein